MKNIAQRILLFFVAFCICVANVLAQNVIWKKHFGGSNQDEYLSVTEVSDGVVAVGEAYGLSFGTGDLAGVTGKGDRDAIIVKYDHNGDVVWKKNFGSSGNDRYNSVTTVSDGVVAVGWSETFGNGDWVGVTGKGYTDAIIVKYDNNGDVVWKKNFGGNGTDWFYSVTAVSDGVVAVGISSDFGTGDWAGVTGKGDNDAIIVKYDHNGDVVWKKNFGGSHTDYYYSVTAVSDGIVAVGQSYYESFGNGDWAGVTGKGNDDAAIVKYDHNGNIVWKKNFGGNNLDYYWSVTTVSDGVVAVGTSWGGFGTGDLAGITGRGSIDVIIVKYDYNGNVVWKKNFGSSYGDHCWSVTAVFDGVVVVGDTYVSGGDWAGVTRKGLSDAFIVKYDHNGNVVWKKNFGGNGMNSYYCVTTVFDGVVAVGYSSSFSSGDWVGVTGKGNDDAIIVKYTHTIFDDNITVDTIVDKVICVGDTFSAITFSGTGATIFSWVSTNTEVGLTATSGTDTLPSFTATNSGTTPISTTITVTPRNSDGIYGIPMSFIITVSPTPIILVQDSSVCQGKDGILVATGAETYIWSNGLTGDTLHVLGGSTTTYTVTGTNIWGCIGTGEGTITVNPTPTVTVYAEDVCNKNDIGTFTALGAETYLWNDGSTDETISAIISATTTYTVTGTDTNGCTNTATGTIKIRKIKAAIYAKVHTIGAEAFPVNFFDHSTGGNPVYWLWSFGDGNISTEQNPSNQYTEVDTYIVQLIVTDDRGCIDTAFYEIKVIIPFHFYIPNSFTPNSNGTNEVFAPKGEGVLEEGYEMLIYNRWGNLLFRTTEPYGSWDGRDKNGNLLPTGVYVYTIKLKTSERKTKTYKGEITLLR